MISICQTADYSYPLGLVPRRAGIVFKAVPALVLVPAGVAQENPVGDIVGDAGE